MLGEPSSQLVCKLFFAEEGFILVIVHDFPDFVEQAFVIRLVFAVGFIVFCSHELLFERKVRGNPGENFAEKIHDFALRAEVHQPVMGLVDEADQFTVLMIDGGDADGKFFIPIDK